MSAKLIFAIIAGVLLVIAILIVVQADSISIGAALPALAG